MEPHPLARTFAAHLGAREEPGWTTTAEIAGPGLDAALALAADSFGTDRADIAGQRVIELVAWRLAVPAAAHLLAAERLPDLSADNVQMWLGAEPPDGVGTALRRPRFYALASDPEAGHPDALPVADEHAQFERLARSLTDLAPLIGAVCAATERPEAALWRSATDRLVAALVWVGQTTGRTERVRELAPAVVAPLHAHAELRTLQAGGTEQLLHVREGCCLYYRVPGGTKCWSCPLLGDAERRALIIGSA